MYICSGLDTEHLLLLARWPEKLCDAGSKGNRRRIVYLVGYELWSLYLSLLLGTVMVDIHACVPGMTCYSIFYI